MPPSRAFLDRIRDHVAAALRDGTLHADLRRGVGLSWSVPIAAYALYAAFQTGDPAQIGLFLGGIGAGLIGDTLRDLATRRQEPSLAEINALLEQALAQQAMAPKTPAPGPAPDSALLADLNEQLHLLETVLRTLDEAHIGDLLTKDELATQLALFGTTLGDSFAQLRAEQQQGFAQQAAHLDRHTLHVDARFDAQQQALLDLAARLDGLQAAWPQLASFDQREQVVVNQTNIALAQFFTGNYLRLADVWINPQEVFDRVDLAHFTGRKWLWVEVRRFLDTHDRGYWVLEAPAGLGKTTFLAWLVQTQGYLHHFSEQAAGQEGIGKALRSLAAQLAARYGLLPDGVISSTAIRPDTFYDLLKQAAEKRAPGSKIVLVVDALDEAGTQPSGNVLGLPQTLPEGVYILASQRPVTVTLTADPSPVYHRLRADDAANEDDMRRFLTAAAGWEKVAQALASSGYTAQQFTDTLWDKSRGLWIYLHYVVHEIDRGQRTPLSLETLPDGMADYYNKYWQRWRMVKETGLDNPDWWDTYLPCLAMLAASREPCTIERLVDWAGIAGKTNRLRHLCNTQWRPFLAVTGQGQQARYRFYHATLREFFEGKLKPDGPTATVELAVELSDATRAAHSKLCDHFLACWGGLDASLPGLRQPELRDTDGGYGLRHLVAHLEAAERVGELHSLLRVEWVDAAPASGADPMRRNAWFVAKEATGQTDGYQADVARAWVLVEEEAGVRLAAETGQADARDDLGELIGLQCRYALIVATIHSLAANVPTELLVALVKHGGWLPQQALAYARQKQDPSTRAEALIDLVPLMPDNQQADVLDDALRTAWEIEVSSYQARALAAVAEQLAKAGRLDDALCTAWQIEVSSYRADALTAVAEQLAKAGRLDEALRTAWEIEDSGYQARALAAVAEQMSGQAQTDVLDEALSTVQGIEDRYYQALTFAGMAERMTGQAQANALDAALSTAQRSESSYLRAIVVADVVEQMAKAGRLDEALHTAREIEHSGYQTCALVAVAEHMAGHGQPETLDKALDEALHEALDEAQSIGDDYERARIVAEVAEQMARAGWLGEALRTAREIEDSGYQARALAAVAERLSGQAQTDVLDEALSTVQGIEDCGYQARALAAVAELMTGQAQADVLDAALSTAQRIESSYSRNDVAANVAEQMAKAGRLDEALSTAQGITNRDYQARTLAAIAANTADRAQTDVLDKALRTAQSIEDGYSQARALAVVAVQMAEAGRVDDALCTAQNIDGVQRIKYGKTRVLAPASSGNHMASQAPADMLEEAMKEALHYVQIDIADISDKAWALARVAACLAEAGRLDEALHTVQDIEESNDRTKVLAGVAAQLAETGRLDEALRMAQDIEDGNDQTWILAVVAARLAEAGRLNEASYIAKEVKDNYFRTLALVGLAAHMLGQSQAHVLNIALRTAEGIEVGNDRARALAVIAAYLAEAGQLVEALRTVRHINDDRARASILAGMAEQIIRAGRLDEAQNMAQEIENGLYRARAFVSVAEQMAKAGRLGEALQTAHGIEDVDTQALALTIVAAHVACQAPADMQEEMLRMALQTARGIEDRNYRARAVAAVAEQMANAGRLEEAMHTAQGIEKGHHRARAMAAVAGQTTGQAQADDLEEALRTAQGIERSVDRTDVLAAVAKPLSHLPPDHLHALWSPALHSLARRTRADLLSDLAALAPVIHRLGGEAALTATAEAIIDVGRWWP